MSDEPLIELKGVTKIFGDRADEALHLLRAGADKDHIRERTGAIVGVNQIDLDIAPGELFVIMGLSGSGKSTLLRCLNRLIEPTAGRIRIAGTDVLALSKTELLRFRQKKMAMVFQQFALLPHRTVLENVAFGLELQDVPRDERLAIAREKLALVGLEGYENQRPEELSGGMQQRVGLARALANDPEILLMDEAFSALDPLIRDEMQNELLGLQSQLRKTIVFITHDLNEALKLGDRIALMRDGSIVQVGTPEQFVSHPADEYVARFVKGIDLTKVLVAADVMKRPSPLIRLKEGPGVALRRLRDAGVSSGFVVDEQGRLAGLVTADQLAGAVRAQVGSIAGIELEHPLLAAPDTPLEQLVRDIVNTRYPLAVVDSGRRLRGIVLKSSILEALASRGGDEDVAEDPAR